MSTLHGRFTENAKVVRLIGWSRRSPLLARVYRHPIDVFPTTIMASVFGLQLLVFLFAEPLLAAVAVAVLFPVQVNFAGMCHNHHHLETFRQSVLNRAFEVMMFLQLGMLPYGYTLHHNIGHHAHYMDPDSDPNRWQRRDGSAMGSWEFALRMFVAMYPTVVRIGRRHPAVFRRFLAMAAFSASVLAALFALNPLNALIVFVLPMPLALILQAQATWYQHVGLTTQHSLEASRSCLDPLYNVRTCNLGYHTAHHLRPALHWSLLPSFHAEIADRIPRDRLV